MAPFVIPSFPNHHFLSFLDLFGCQIGFTTVDSCYLTSVEPAELSKYSFILRVFHGLLPSNWPTVFISLKTNSNSAFIRHILIGQQPCSRHWSLTHPPHCFLDLSGWPLLHFTEMMWISSVFSLTFSIFKKFFPLLFTNDKVSLLI